jgi:hypothetical protein
VVASVTVDGEAEAMLYWLYPGGGILRASKRPDDAPSRLIYGRSRPTAVVDMEISNITATVFTAYLQCPIKGLFIARGENPPQTLFLDLQNNISEAYKAKVGGNAFVNFPDLVTSSSRKDTITLFDCQSAFYNAEPSAAIYDGQVKKANDYIPVLYSPWNKLDQSNRLTICFGAMAIAQMMGTELQRTRGASTVLPLPAHPKVRTGRLGRAILPRYPQKWPRPSARGSGCVKTSACLAVFL